MNKQELLDKLKKEKFSEKIINAFEKIKREDFIDKKFEKLAYEDSPLPIGFNQTISQPYTIAFMLDLLDVRDNQKILEIGSGSGYVLALINELGKNLEIYGIERIKEIAEKSRKILKKYENITILNMNGSRGLREKAPFDRILASASADKIPNHLLSQLKPDGILVAPVQESIIKIEKTPKENKLTEYPGFVFVPLVKD